MSLLFLKVQGQNHFALGVFHFEKRAEGAIGLKANPLEIANAIYHFKMALHQQEKELESSVYLLKSYYFQGTFVDKTASEKISTFYEGKVFGEVMAKKYPNSPAIQFWYLTSMGKWAEQKSGWASAKDGVADKMKLAAEQAIAIDPNYHDASCYRVLGMLHVKCPYIPFILNWPDDKVGLINCEKSYTLGASNPGNYVSYAEALFENGKKEKSIAVLKEAIQMVPRPELFLEDKKEIEDAKTMLADYLEK